MGATQFHGRETAIHRREPCGADLTEDLAFRAIILVKKGFGGIAAGTGAVVRDVTL